MLKTVAMIFFVVIFISIILFFINNRWIFKINYSFKIRYCYFFIQLIWLLASLILGGIQFMVYQGNHYDAFNYIESALTYVLVPSSKLDWPYLDEIIRFNGFPHAIVNYTVRPSVSIVIGTLASFDLANILYINYIFLYYCMFLSVLGLYKLSNLILGINNNISYLVCSIFLFGYWGQYILDINSFAMVVWLPIMIYLIYHIFEITVKNYDFSLLFKNSITLVAGCLFMYPEGFSFYFIPIGILLINHIQIKYIKYYIISISTVCLLCIPIFKSNIFLIYTQLKIGLNGAQFWRYFDGALIGHVDITQKSSLETLTDILSGLFGFYYLTPFQETDHNLSLLVRTVYLIMFISIIYVIYYNFKFFLNDKLKTQFTLFIFLLTTQSIYFICNGNYWTAGKAISYYSPLAILYFIFNLYFYVIKSRKKIIIIVVLLFLSVSNISFGFYRIYAIYKNTNGLHYKLPYPSAQDAGIILKTYFDFSDNNFLYKINDNEIVMVDIKDPWVEAYAEILLSSRSIKYTSNNVIYLETGYPKYNDKIIKVKSPDKIVYMEYNKNRLFPYYLCTKSLLSK